MFDLAIFWSDPSPRGPQAAQQKTAKHKKTKILNEKNGVNNRPVKGTHADKMEGRRKVRISPNTPDRAPKAATAEHDAKESDESKRIRQVKRRADNIRAHANMLTSIASDIHSRWCKPKVPAMRRMTHGGGPRDYNISQTSLAFKTHAIALCYSHLAHDDQDSDAGDGGQQIFEEFLNIDISCIQSCPKFLKLAGKLKEVAADWGQTHVKLAKAEITASHVWPKECIKHMSRVIGAAPSNSLKYVKRDCKTNDWKRRRHAYRQRHHHRRGYRQSVAERLPGER